MARPSSRRTRLLRELATYGVAHQTPGNVAVHVVAVPLLVYSAAAVLGLLELHSPAWLLFALAALKWITLAEEVGALATALYGGLVWLALRSRISLFRAASLHIVSWAAQLLSHALIEQRRPAFLTGLAQAFSTAPLFVLFDVLFALNHDPALKGELDVAVRAATRRR